MNKADQMIFAVRDLNTLISEYGLAEITHALQYITTYPNAKQQYQFKNTMGADWWLTQEEYDRIVSTNPSVNKIQAIKMFREITSCGLKEAKDAIENRFYPNQVNRPW